MNGPFRIRERLAAAFIVIALLTTAGAGFLAQSFVSRSLQEHVRADLGETALLVSRSDFAFNPSILRLAAEVSHSHIVTFTREGIVAEGGAAGRTPPGSVLASMAVAARVDATNAHPVFTEIEHDGVPYYVAYRPVDTNARAYVAVALDVSRLAEGRRAALSTLLAVAAAAILVMALAGYVLARRLSRPIEETLVRSEKLAVTGLLAARVAHDVRNPLSSIKMHTQLLQSRLKGDVENQALLAEMRGDIEQVETVVRGLLDLARPGDIHPRPSDLNAVVAAVLAQMEPQLTHRKIKIETALDPALPAIPLDPDRFRQALINVLQNAADAMAGGGTLLVRTAPGDGGSTVILDVCDDGTGIDPQVAPRLFNPFVTSKRDGVGLGLVNTKATVESHGGDITLTPRASGGTHARITLPLTHG